MTKRRRALRAEGTRRVQGFPEFAAAGRRTLPVQHLPQQVIQEGIGWAGLQFFPYDPDGLLHLILLQEFEHTSIGRSRVSRIQPFGGGEIGIGLIDLPCLHV